MDWTDIKAAVERFRSRPSPRPPFVGTVRPEGKLRMESGRIFSPEESYFSIQVVELQLAEGGVYFTEFLPVGVCVAEYTYGAERRRVPLVLSNEAAQKIVGETAESAGHVKFRNIPVVRKAPFKADNVSLFVGLFRAPYSDIAESLLQLAADVSQEFGGAAARSGIGAAGKIYDRVARIFSLNKVTPRFAYLDGVALSTSAYLLVSGPLPPDMADGDFVVVGEPPSLQHRSNAKALSALDYCLLALEQHGSLFEKQGSDGSFLGMLSTLPFHERWREVGSFLVKRQRTEAEEALMTLRANIVASPDLTEADRLIAIGAYDLAFNQWSGRLSADATVSAENKRSGSNEATVVTNIRALEKETESRGQAGTAAALSFLALQLQKGVDPKAPAPSRDASDEVIRKASDEFAAKAVGAMRDGMMVARGKGARAAGLAEALTIGGGWRLS